STWYRHRPAAMPTPQRCFRLWAAAGGTGRISPRAIMENNSGGSRPPTRCSRRFPHAAAFALVAAILTCSACTSREDDNRATVTAANARLTPAQREHIQLYKVAPSRFRRTLETTAAVDFDNDQATSVLAPFSGPVSRLLVSLGDQVSKGQPLATVD